MRQGKIRVRIFKKIAVPTQPAIEESGERRGGARARAYTCRSDAVYVHGFSQLPNQHFIRITCAKKDNIAKLFFFFVISPLMGTS